MHMLYKRWKNIQPEMIRKRFTELKDGVYQVIIKTRGRRSLLQNAYYWGVVCDMVDDGLRDAGYDGVKDGRRCP